MRISSSTIKGWFHGTSIHFSVHPVWYGTYFRWQERWSHYPFPSRGSGCNGVHRCSRNNNIGPLSDDDDDDGDEGTKIDENISAGSSNSCIDRCFTGNQYYMSIKIKLTEEMFPYLQFRNSIGFRKHSAISQLEYRVRHNQIFLFVCFQFQLTNRITINMNLSWYVGFPSSISSVAGVRLQSFMYLVITTKWCDVWSQSQTCHSEIRQLQFTLQLHHHNNHPHFATIFTIWSDQFPALSLVSSFPFFKPHGFIIQLQHKIGSCVHTA